MDNYFKDCPPKMDDGRYLTDFRPTSIREQFIKSINGIVRDDEYRNFLQKNGESIIDREWSALRKTQSCHTNECVHIYISLFYESFIYKIILSTSELFFQYKWI